jgi:feruloyl esterase
MKTNKRPFICILFLLLLPFSEVLAQEKKTRIKQLCEELEDLKMDDAFILSASLVTEDENFEDYCLVTGYILPAIHFEVRLPVDNWNYKFFMQGCGGLCGSLSISKYMGGPEGLRRGYAVSNMDAGHWGKDSWDFRWAYNNRQAEIDWAYRAVHETARVSKKIIEKFYGKHPYKSYFQGCSTGGRMALMEATKYPEDFDGIISEGPVMNNTGLYISLHWAARKNIGSDGKDIISPDDIGLITEAVYEQCDALDGKEDGIIDDPRACNFDPQSLKCDSDNGEGCLSEEQIEVLEAWYGGPKNSKGEQLYPGGIVLGSEPYWGNWIVGNTDNVEDNVLGIASLEFFRYMGFREDPGESYSMFDFDFDNDPARLEYMGKIINSDNPDLDAFEARGGKLIMYHGWADVNVTPWKTIQYYKEVENRFGGEARTQNFFRLFMIPGMDHCGFNESLGISRSSIDPLTALEKWVETGNPPDELKFTKFDTNGDVEWERHLYPFSESK